MGTSPAPVPARGPDHGPGSQGTRTTHPSSRNGLRAVGPVALALLLSLAGACSSPDRTQTISAAPLVTPPGATSTTGGAEPADQAVPPTLADGGTTSTPGTDPGGTGAEGRTDATGETGDQATAPTAAAGSDAVPPPAWLGTRALPVDADGVVPPQQTPAELEDRRLLTTDLLPPPASTGFEWSIGPLEGDPLARSTWTEGCPVGVEELRYLTLSFWGFDGRPHTGELIVNQSVAEDLVSVFSELFTARFPIEEMRIATPADLAAEPTGDGNNTTAFVCRAVTGGTRFSEHAYGLAIDINSFHNPYLRGDVVIPELAASYLDRGLVRPGMILDGDVVVAAFDRIGWGWGGRWRSLKDYQHFALHDR